MNTIRVNELFCSLQGEGYNAGTPALFLRLQGCPVACLYCDTPHAKDPAGGAEYAIEALGSTLQELAKDTALLVVTGGEPLLQPVSLLQLIYRDFPCPVHIETSGAGLVKFLPALCTLEQRDNIRLNLSPKSAVSLGGTIELIAYQNAWWAVNQIKLVWPVEQLDAAEAFFDTYGGTSQLEGRLFIQPLHLCVKVFGSEPSADELRQLQAHDYQKQLHQIVALYSAWVAAHPRWRLSLQLHKLLNVR